jgi:hypothetical protein
MAKLHLSWDGSCDEVGLSPDWTKWQPEISQQGSPPELHGKLQRNAALLIHGWPNHGALQQLEENGTHNPRLTALPIPSFTPSAGLEIAEHVGMTRSSGFPPRVDDDDNR